MTDVYEWKAARPGPSLRVVGKRRRRSRWSLEALIVVLLALGGAASAAEEGEEEEPQEPHTATSILKREGYAPTISLHGFGDVTLHAEEYDPSNATGDISTGFAEGELDLFIVSHLTRNISFLSEIVFEQDVDGHGVIDIERFWIKYAQSDRFWLSMGRHHVPLGYWNRTYHHGLLLQPTVRRPEALKFEDDPRGGFLPIHQVGLMSGGTAFGDAWRLDYIGGVFNGRGTRNDEVQGSGDLNDEKAAGIGLNFIRETDRRLLFGPTLYFDNIPADPLVPGREGEIEETIYGGQFNYRDDWVEVLTEYYRIDHRDELTSAGYDHSSWFAIAILRHWTWKPYAGIDRMALEPGDLYFSNLTDLRRYLAGVRWDIHPFVAAKFEYRHDERPGVKLDAFDMQVAFTF